MNKGWRNLVIIGVLALLFTIGWEIYQAGDGGRADFIPFINVLDRNNLFPTSLENHIKNGSANLVDVDREVVDSSDQEDEFGETVLENSGDTGFEDDLGE
jgi:hypothetical protein